MPWIAAVEAEDGQVLAKLVVHHHNYVLDAGRTVSIETCVAWCRGCNRFTVAEDIKTPDALDRQLEATTARYRQLRSEPVTPQGAMSSQQQAQMVEQVIEAARRRYSLLKRIFAQRKGPARCLDCGGRDFVRVERDIADWVSDPRGGEGRVRVRITQESSPATPAGRYNIEGKRLRK